MRIDRSLKSATARLVSDVRGNFGIMSAVLIPVLLAAVAVSMDMSKLLADKTQLASAMDAASLATASALTNGDITVAQAQTFAARIAGGQLTKTLSVAQITELKASIAANVTANGTGNNKDYTVKVTGQFTEKLLAFSTFHAGGSRVVKGSSTATSQAQSTSAISLYLVVDRSGSMSWTTDTKDTSKPNGCWNYFEKNWPDATWSKPCYINKMSSLKTAADALFDEMDSIEASDNTNSVVRTGVVSFNDDTQSPSNLAWGTTKARKYVTDLPDNPTGGTDMTGGMQKAYDSLADVSETNVQVAKGNTEFFKYIVLMTDGENTGSSGTWNKSLDTKTLQTCTAARGAGMTVFTVAYMAPANGEALLKACAGDLTNYYKATDMDSLVKAFADIGGKVTKQTTRMTN
jgi:Flp pilus assembly protein TadG